ncbi:MAG: MlaD family protein [candidate division WOR-3 bacterium]
MENLASRIRTGILILLGIGILIGGYLWFIKWQFGRKVHRYKVNVSSAAWVQKGTLVTISGVPKGRVESLQLYPDSVILFISIEDYALMDSAFAIIENQGIMGERRVEVYMGQGDTLAEWATIPGYDTPTIGDLVERADKLMKDVDTLALEARSAIKGVSERTQALEAQVTSTLTEIEALSKELRVSVRKASERTDTSFARFDSLIVHLDSVSVALRALVESEGTAQRLAKDDKLYKDLEKTIRSAQDLIEDIRANPKRYFTIEIF